MKKICRWACRHRAGLLALAVGFAAWGLFYIARRSTAAMDWWLTYVSMPVKRGLSFIVDPLPFSACELGATVLIVGSLVLLVRAVRRRRLAAWALHMAVLLVWGYAGVCALWGTQYYGTNFAARAGMTAPPVSTGELAAVTDYFADKVNAAAPLVQRDESGVFADHGYVRSNGGRFVDIYDGKVENIPEEYRIKSPKLYERAVVGRTEKDMER